MSAKFFVGEETKLVMNRVDEFNLEEDPDTLVGYIESISNRPIMAEGIRKICKSHGYDGDIEDNKEIRAFILAKLKDKLIIKNAGEENNFRTNITNWLNEGKGHSAPSDNSNSRINVYKMCFALGLSKEEVEEFFLKSFLVKPFNLHVREEAVYYYVLCNKREYTDAEKIIKRIELFKNKASSEGITETNTIESDISLIKDDEEFINYYCRNINYFDSDRNSLRATKRIEELRKDCQDWLREGDYEATSDDFTDLLRDIYGGQKTYYDKTLKKNIKANLTVEKVIKILKKKTPKRINMPAPIDFSNIKHGNKVSADVIRKVLLLLDFYSFFMASNDTNYDENSHAIYFDDFVAEVNDCFEGCGYTQLYARNPFDWVFIFCAKQDEPIATFRRLVEVYCNIDYTNDF